MTETGEFKALQRLALASLGRNILHFQRVEAQLKRLVLLCDFVSPRSEFAERHAERVDELRTTTMGNLVKELHQRLYGKPAEPEVQEPIREVVIGVGLRVNRDADYIDLQKKRLKDLVHERNNLIHQDLAEFDPNAEESCRRWITRLDEQNERIEAQHRELKQLLDLHNEAAKHILTFMQSGEYRLEWDRAPKKL